MSKEKKSDSKLLAAAPISCVLIGLWLAVGGGYDRLYHWVGLKGAGFIIVAFLIMSLFLCAWVWRSGRSSVRGITFLCVIFLLSLGVWACTIVGFSDYRF